MSELIKHECGIALLRLKKPLSYFQEKYGTPLYGLNRMQLLMEKMHNRGQDGAGLATIKLDVKPGRKYIHRRRSGSRSAIQDIFNFVEKKFTDFSSKYPAPASNADAEEQEKYARRVKKRMHFAGELLMGHLRYGTHGKSGIEFCHPVKRSSNWRVRNLLMAGNFNLNNVHELFQLLLDIGQHPTEKSDTVTVLEKFGHYLDYEVQNQFEDYKFKLGGIALSKKIEEKIDLLKIIKKSAAGFDGGFVMGGIIGNGDAFVLRDPNGIRPAHYYENDEIVVVASERVAIQTAFNLRSDEVVELPPAHALIIRKNGEVSLQQYTATKPITACSFERIYFSRGNDRDIYNERIALGHSITPRILEAINHDIENSVFTFIPNTAEVSFYGMMKGIDEYLNLLKREEILDRKHKLNEEELKHLLSIQARVEKILIKDQKMRTFITNDNDRDDLVAHVYDVTYGKINRGKDTLVAIDDSIVRGTTLKKSILRILGRLEPKKIVIISSAPQIRYPDCYGIDMAKLGDFIAFRAMQALISERNMEALWEEVYDDCLAEMNKPTSEMVNHVQRLYAPFSDEEISAKIAELITPPDFSPSLEVIYQTVDNLHKACPNHLGDWYFTGNYPTPGGNRVANLSFVYAHDNVNERAY